ncbi:uncharacterized protein DS421_14g480140 [Arachis hypogaea]|nr:uncharacterized protein DS421_14g480140 [Arachis hypogaea]
MGHLNCNKSNPASYQTFIYFLDVNFPILFFWTGFPVLFYQRMVFIRFTSLGFHSVQLF